MNVSSPCVNLCQLDDRGLCRGCARTLAEIARWSSLDDAEKSCVLALLDGRRGEIAPASREENS